MTLFVEGNPETTPSGDTFGDWLDTRELGAFQLIFTALTFLGTTATLNWFVEGGVKNAAGVTVVDGAATALIPTASFTQATQASALPNIQIKSFRQGGDVAKWPRFIRVNLTIGGTDNPSWTTRIDLVREVSP